MPRSKPRTRSATDRLPTPADARAFSTRLRRWFRRHQRRLPWRETRDPYRVLVSELMLQQTQVSRVLIYYERFLTSFPSLQQLADARPKRVLEAWEGLGYYARARNLHKLARQVTRDGADGTLPSHPDDLAALPGVGRYTAGAVASFAYERRSALVDTNVARVLARVFAPRLHPKRARDLTKLWEIAERVLPRTGKSAWTHNQAVMELGALVCTARVKRCGVCPVGGLCRSVESGGGRGKGGGNRRQASLVPRPAHRVLTLVRNELLGDDIPNPPG